MTGEDLASAARALVGVPFRLHGRDPRTGLDCVGVLAAALEASGRSAQLPNGYALRTHGLPEVSDIACRLGMNAISGPFGPGDVLLLRPSPCQLHMAIVVGPQTVVHAHAGLRKVVIGPLIGNGPLVAGWRLRSAPTE